MPRPPEEETNWHDDGWQEDEGVGESDEEDEPTIPCPYCRREIFEDSPQCPHCGQYVVESGASATPKPWLIIVGVLLCLLVVWLWIMR